MNGTVQTAAPAACFGAIHLDLIAHAKAPIHRETSTPSTMRGMPGGVATNVARGLAKLGVPVALSGALGDDGDGAALRSFLGREQLNLHGVRTLAMPTGRYVALHDPDGSLAAAVVDTEITESLDTSLARDLSPAARAAGLWFIEANLSQTVLEALAQASGSRLLAADAVSNAKAARLRPILPRLDILFVNRGEAAHLAGLSSDAPQEELGAALRALGLGAVVITAGAKPLFWSKGEAHGFLPPPPAMVHDVTGAGDALMAGTLAGIARNLPLSESLEKGLAAAAMTLAVSGAVAAGLSWEALEALPSASASR
ncbi:PfkB family carbohydrate kinase [Pannonibacter indicus]|uniref:Sugar or nucleoside kinase, ribokinase family n=1 Tax=Pannonibacter indicus TaxID=466044 RepID=A0A0K6HLQ5_9HYPH|nr:PfkB family carbohydrate kinase [Pannonibacter indicus]CUA91723.1 Sugar or nucleoside kinase, ribokinase family [Pannonibacter indicus]